jgi:hypothetical protein
VLGGHRCQSAPASQPVIGAPLNRSVSLTIIDGEEISVFVAFGRGVGRTSARAVAMLSARAHYDW